MDLLETQFFEQDPDPFTQFTRLSIQRPPEGPWWPVPELEAGIAASRWRWVLRDKHLKKKHNQNSQHRLRYKLACLHKCSTFVYYGLCNRNWLISTVQNTASCRYQNIRAEPKTWSSVLHTTASKHQTEKLFFVLTNWRTKILPQLLTVSQF